MPQKTEAAPHTLTTPQGLVKLGEAFERRIDFTPEQWLKAPWRRLGNIERPKPRPFNIDLCIAEIDPVLLAPYGWFGIWDKTIAKWSTQEAEFWLHLCNEATEYGVDKKKVLAHLKSRTFTGQFTEEELQQFITHAQHPQRAYANLVAYPLSVLLSITDLIPVMRLNTDTNPLSRLPNRVVTQIITAFDKNRLPYLTLTELTQLSTAVYTKLQQGIDEVEAGIIGHFAIKLGLSDLCEQVLDSAPATAALASNYKDVFKPHINDFVFGLDCPEKVLKYGHARHLVLETDSDVYAWIAHTEYSDLGKVADSICKKVYPKDEAARLIRVLSKVNAPEAAMPMLQCLLRSIVPAEAHKWLDEHPAFAFAALAEALIQPNALSESERTKCKRYLNDLLCKIDNATIPETTIARLTEAGIEFAEEVHGTAAEPPPWLKQAFDQVLSERKKKSKLPIWLQSVAYVPVVIEGWKLSSEQTAMVLEALQQSAVGKVHPLISTLKTNAASKVFDRFLWDIFERWLYEDAPPKEKWTLVSMGFLASDQILLRVIPFMYKWREMGLAPRAGFGLECLRASGSDFALMTIQQISDAPKLKSLRMKAIECMKKIAEDKGLSKEQLEDRIVPSCGFDDSGKRVFDFGPRKFSASIGSDLKIVVRDENGKVKSDLPAPNQKDDAAMATAAVEDFKQLKKQVKAVAKAQVNRLEQSMVVGRKWQVEEFASLLMKHPLMSNFVRMLVWCGYDQDGKMLGTFRVTDENECADINDRQIELNNFRTVGVAHPLYLDNDTRARWGEVFGDYEIVAPFPQLARPVYRLTEAELSLNKLTRFALIKVPSVTIPSTLERFGWVRGIAGDGGWFDYHYKHFFGANVTAVVQYKGMPNMLLMMGEPQAIDECYFLPGIHKFTYTRIPESPEPLGKIDPVVISEVLNDLTILTSKGKEA